MREIRAERYKTSQARYGDRLEKHNRRKRTQERERKTSFIKYEQKQTHFNGRRKLLSKSSCGATPRSNMYHSCWECQPEKTHVLQVQKALKIHQMSEENSRLLCVFVSEGTLYTLLLDHAHFLVAVKAQLAVSLRCLRKNESLGQHFLLLIKISTDLPEILIGDICLQILPKK